jgi:hypothetical protein
VAKSLKSTYNEPAESLPTRRSRDIARHLSLWRDPLTRRRCGELSEICSSAAVHFGDRVGVVAQRGGPAAVAEAGGGVAQVDASGQELAGRIVPQRLDIQGYSRGPGDLGDLVGYLVGIPGPFAERVGGEHVRVQRKLDADLAQLIVEDLAMFGEHSDSDLVDSEAAVLMCLGVLPDFGATGDTSCARCG